MKNLFQNIISILDFVFILFDFLTAEKKPAPAAMAETVPPTETPDEKPFIDKRIKALSDTYAFQITRRMRGEKDYLYKGWEELLMHWAQEACFGRHRLEQEQGIKLPTAQMHSVMFVSGRAEAVSCRFDFIDESETTVYAKPRREDMEQLKTLDVRMKRFLN